MIDLLAALSIAIGVAFDFFGCVGLVRLPDVYTRLQASTKCVTLGTCLILLGVILAAVGSSDASTAVKALVCAVFVLVTCPTAAHALARGAYLAGIRPSPSVVDRYGEKVDDEKA